MTAEIMYRNDSCYGSEIYDPVRVITYEILELGNTDVLDYCLENYGDSLSNELEDDLNDILNAIDEEDVERLDVEGVQNIISQLINELEENVFNTSINYVLWLAEKDVVIDSYDGTDENMSGYQTSDIILSDLGEDGILFGYTDRPVEVEIESYTAY